MFLVTCFIKLNARANYRHPLDISLSTIDTRGACRRQIACLLLRVCLLTQERSGLQSATINYIVKSGITLCKESLCLSPSKFLRKVISEPLKFLFRGYWRRTAAAGGGLGNKTRFAHLRAATCSSWGNGGASFCAGRKPSAPSSHTAQELI